MSNFFHITFVPKSALVLWSIILVLASGFLEATYAQSPPSTSIVNSECSAMNQYGFTSGLVYCVQSSITSSVALFSGILQQKLGYYEFMMMVVAIIIFGIKLMNYHIEQPKKEAAMLILRIMVGVFFFSQASNLYTTIAGPNGLINESVGWVTGFSSTGGTTSSGSGGNMFSSLVSSQCAVDSPPQAFQGYQVWQAFDCMFAKLFGAANPVKHPQAFGTSLLVIIGVALLSATTGFTLALIGIMLFLGVMLLLCRALLMVLVSYMCIGFLAILAPLIAPLVFFDSKFLNEKFKRWLGLFSSCFFQPIFVIGFLAMAVTVDDQLMEGTLAGCTPPTAVTATSTVANEPAGGWGQDGVGVCSFTQLFNQGGSNNTVGLLSIFNQFIEPNATILNMAVQGDTQEHIAKNGDSYNGVYTPAGVTSDNYQHFELNTGVTNVINLMEQFITNTGNMHITGPRLKSFAPTKQLILTLLTFIFVTYVMYELMEIIPKMAAEMTIVVGMDLSSALKVPFEDTIRGALNSVQEKGGELAEGKGIIPQGVSALKKSITPKQMAGVRPSVR